MITVFHFTCHFYSRFISSWLHFVPSPHDVPGENVRLLHFHQQIYVTQLGSVYFGPCQSSIRHSKYGSQKRSGVFPFSCSVP